MRDWVSRFLRGKTTSPHCGCAMWAGTVCARQDLCPCLDTAHQMSQRALLVPVCSKQSCLWSQCSFISWLNIKCTPCCVPQHRVLWNLASSGSSQHLYGAHICVTRSLSCSSSLHMEQWDTGRHSGLESAFGIIKPSLHQNLFSL